MNLRKLIQSIRQGDVTLLQAAIDHGEDINIRCPDTGQSLANLVISLDNDAVMDVLLACEAFDWNMPDEPVCSLVSEDDAFHDFVMEAPVPSGQARLWAQQFLLPQSQQSVYHVPVGLPLEGRYDVNAIKQALRSLMNQHDALRCHFASCDDGLNMVAAKGVALPFEQVELAKDSPELAKFCKQHFEKPFDLNQAPLWRVMLVRHDEASAYLYFVYHHIIVDGDSLDILLRDFTAYYNHSVNHATPCIPDEQPNHFLQTVSRPKSAKQQDCDYWRAKMKDYPDISQPMLDKPRPALPSYDGQIYRFNIQLPDTIQEICQHYKTTLTSLMFAVYNLLLYKITGQQDLIIGAPTSSRDTGRLSDTVGYFIDTLPIRSQIEPNQTLSDFIAQVAENRSLAYAHQSLDFPGILKLLGVKNNPSITPLFQSFFIMMEQQALQQFALEGLRPLTSLDARGISFDKVDYTSSKYDLTLRVDQQGRTLACSFEFVTDCYHESTIALFAEYFNHLLTQVLDTSNPKPCDQLSLSEERIVSAPVPLVRTSSCLLENLKRHAKYRPTHCALRDVDGEMNYKNLWMQVSALAMGLKAKITSRQPVIAIMMERGRLMVVSQLAIMAMGATYVPIDPDYPAERKRSIVLQSQARLVLGDGHIDGVDVETVTPSAVAQPCRQNDLPLIAAETIAYILFTSGSTGEPKGIAVSYGALMSFLQGIHQVLPLSQQDVWLSITNPGFDISGYEYFGPLSVGATCVIADKVSVQDGALLKGKIDKVKPTIMQATPITWENLADSGWVIPAGFRALCGGEKLTKKAHTYLTESAGHAYQLYGPTEATIWATFTEMRRGCAANNIGRVLPHMCAFVLDDAQRPLPPMVPGELYLAGSGLADGYWQDTVKTSQVFITIENIPGIRLYRTGDRVRLMPDGTIEYISRIDTQLKVNGYRIEAGDVETAFKSFVGVDHCVVIHANTDAGSWLVACVQAGSDINRELLRNHVEQRLPPYMVPAAIHLMDKFPVNNRGKIDKAQLTQDYLTVGQDIPAAIEQTNADDLDWFVNYLTPFAKEKADTLDLRQVNFFDLGLKSRHVIEMARAFSHAQGQIIRPALFYQYTTPRLLVSHLASSALSHTLQEAVVVKAVPHEPVAIVGMACRYPGADSVDAFWTMLMNMQSGLYRYTAEELRALNIPDALAGNNRYVPVAGRINGIDLFDANFFGFNPKEAALTSPAQRVFMELVWHALEDANSADLEGSHERVGIFAGCGDNDYVSGGYENPTTYQAMLGTEKDYLATRVAFKLGLTGPAVNLQTACSSSLTALHYAMNSIQMGECSFAIAGGVSIVPVKEGGYLAKDGFMFSPSGRCAPFSNQADGIIASHGAGVVVLKPLSKAQLDGDRIYGLVKGSAVNNDGSQKASYVAPSPEKQAEVIEMALQRAAVDKHSISYVEAHGTGTKLGDPIEVNGLRHVYGGRDKHSIAIGSAKSNIGHTIAASGIAGVIKATLAIYHQVLPGTLYAQSTSGEIDFESSPFYVQQQTAPWRAAHPRRAGVSSFGIGGTNVHAILEEAPLSTLSDERCLAHQWQAIDDCAIPTQKSQDDGPWLFALSAKTERALNAQVHQLIALLEKNNTINLADLSYTLTFGRAQMKHRVIVEAATVTELVQALQSGGITLQAASFGQEFKAWYQADAYFQSLVNSCAATFDKASGLGRLSEVLRNLTPNAYQKQALLLVYQCSALRRYQASGLSVDNIRAHGTGMLAYQVVNGKIGLGAALNQVLTEAKDTYLSMSDIDVNGGQSAFRQVIQHAFMKGLRIDWQGYWRGSVRQKVSVPLYPFERKRYWHENDSAVKEMAVANLVSGLLSGVPIAVSDDEWLFQQELSLSNPQLAYLSNHRVFSFCVFPGAGYTEFLLSAARKVNADAVIEINELAYVEPLQLIEGQTRICQVHLKKQDDGIFVASIFSYEQSGCKSKAITHAQGRLTILPGSSQQRRPHVQIDRLAKLCTSSQDVAEIYEGLANDGVHYGEDFRGVKTFTFNTTGTKSFAKIALDTSQSTAGHTIHPILLDSAFQSMVGVLLMNKNVPKDMTYIPAGHGHARFYGEMTATGYVQGTVVPSKDDRELNGNLAIYTEQGDLAVMINGFCLIQVPKAALEKRFGASQAGEIFYQLHFKPTAGLEVGETKRTWLVIDSQKTVGVGVKEKILARGDKVTMAKAADIDDAMLSSLGSSVGVIYLDGLQEHKPEQLANAAWQLMQLVKKLKQKNVRVNRFMVVGSNDTEQGIYQGFCNSLSSARPEWQVSLVDIAGSNQTDCSQIVSDEAQQDRNVEMMVKYRDGNRLAGRICRYQPTIPTALAEKLFGPHESCLVTGGLGGLGLRVAEWLVSNGAKNLVLLSRTERNALPEIIDHWRAQHIDVAVKTVDVSDKAALTEVFEGIKSSQRPLAGVFHLAGALRDALIEKLAEADFEAVFAAKVLGSDYLHQLTLNEKALRYFVLFSSLVSIIGSPAQINYAAANGYLDALSEKRRGMGLPAQRVNFGAWAEVGMAANLTDEQKRHGMDQISVKEGLQAMGMAMTSNQAIIAARVNWGAIWRERRQFGLVSEFVHQDKPVVLDNPAIMSQLAGLNVSTRNQQLQAYVIKLLTCDTGEPASVYLDALDEGFEDLGLQSMSIESISQKIRDDFPELSDLDSQLLYTYPTINRLVIFLSERVAQVTQRQSGNRLSTKAIREWVKETREYERRLSLVAQAVIKDHCKSVVLFAKAGKLNQPENIPLTILAALSKSADMMRLLVHNGQEVNVSFDNNSIITPLTVAVAMGNVSVVDFLLSQSCPVTSELLAMDTSPQVQSLLEAKQERGYEHN
ncbi:MAG: amino acid adenylation domain-containing protein [Legionellaceae bacterium]|nr:amino acid adenylation domain-containing protein [Legionellaceae bacterium]